MTRIQVKHGTEGPHHDPYGYQEVIVYRHGHEYTVHAGLDVWIEVDGIKQEMVLEDYDDGGSSRFAALTGAPPALWLRWHDDGRMRCECGGKKLKEDKDGYIVCTRCNDTPGYILDQMMEDSYGRNV